MLATTRRKIYGTTWWGKAWVDALERIDTNRLARGKSYANTGKVLSISVQEGVVKAKVKGSYYDAYSIKIQAESFKKTDVRVIQALIAQQPSLAIELSTGQLPPVLLEQLETLKLQLLPKRWSDLKSSCSCPDWANPCKHLAAVYYVLANEIDKDPFILFQLKGVTQEELTQGLMAQSIASAPKQSPVLSHFLKNKVSQNKSRLTPQQSPQPSMEALESLNFTFPMRNIRPVLSLLSDNPPFFQEGNFKSFLEQIYQHVPQSVQSHLEQLNETPKLAHLNFQLEFYKDEYSPQHLYRVYLEVPESFDAALIQSELKLELPLIEDLNTISNRVMIEAIEPVLNYFLMASITLDPDKSSDSFLFLNAIASTSLGLVRARCFIPELFYETEKDFRVRYVPFVQDEAIQNTIDTLKSMMPPNLCLFGEHRMTSDGVNDLLSLFITHLVYQSLESQLDPKSAVSGNRVVKLFSENYLYRASKLTDSTIASSIANWLEKLHLSKQVIVPVIRFEEARQEEHFKLQVDVLDRQNTLSPLRPYTRVTGVHQQDVARQLIIAGHYITELKTIVDSRGKKSPTLSLTRMSDILSHSAGILDVMGIQLILPKALKKLAYPNLYAKATIKKSKGSLKSAFSMDDMLEFAYEIALGDMVLTPQQFRQLVKKTEGLVKYQDQYIMLDPESVQALLAKLKEPIPDLSDPMQALYTSISQEINGIPLLLSNEMKKRLAALTAIEPVNIPDNLNATLRPYQERGYQWLWSNTQRGFGSCIADDMGLGKTIQVISVLLQAKNTLKSKQPSLVICPTTLIGNWEKECQKFAPDLKVSIYHGSERTLSLKGQDVVITSYGIVRRDIEKFRKTEWQFLIIDEAQNIKNTQTVQTQTVKSLKAKSRIAMSGTPVENRLSELWSIFDFINQGYMGGLMSFKTKLAIPIEKYKDPDAIERLKRVTAPFMIRRLKTDKSIISDLPDKLTIDEYCYLTKEQAAIYQNIVESTMQQIETAEGMARRGLIFKLIMALKQVCNHPAHYAKRGQANPEQSGKATKTLDILRTILDNREKAILFTQFREMGDLLQTMIQDALGEETSFFHGAIPRKKRDEMVQRFQTDRKHRLMIISLKAGGTGLNLTEASNVIHYDLWWNPAVENQATDRAYRIGQKNKVTVHRLITLGTFEEKIDEMIKSKQELANLTLSSGENWVSELSNDQLRDIFTLMKS